MSDLTCKQREHFIYIHYAYIVYTFDILIDRLLIYMCTGYRK